MWIVGKYYYIWFDNRLSIQPSIGHLSPVCLSSNQRNTKIDIKYCPSGPRWHDWMWTVDDLIFGGGRGHDVDCRDVLRWPLCLSGEVSRTNGAGSRIDACSGIQVWRRRWKMIGDDHPLVVW